jgi:hypothetical protein
MISVVRHGLVDPSYWHEPAFQGLWCGGVGGRSLPLEKTNLERPGRHRERERYASSSSVRNLRILPKRTLFRVRQGIVQYFYPNVDLVQ